MRKILKITILLSAIPLGLFLTFKFLWHRGAAGWLAFIGSAVSLFAILALVNAIVTFFFPSFNHKFLLNSSGYNAHFKKDKSAGKSTLLYLFLIVTIIGGLTYYIVVLSKKHESEQLKNYGQIQKVGINSTFGGKSVYANFFILWKGKTISSHLYLKAGMKVGDSAMIIFSTDNTEIVEWLDDYNDKIQ